MITWYVITNTRVMVIAFNTKPTYNILLMFLFNINVTHGRQSYLKRQNNFFVLVPF